MNNPTVGRTLRFIYRRLMATYGPQHWWPAERPFEVIIGAILTQSAAWVNVEKAMFNLKAAGALSPEGLRRLGQDELACLIHSCGYYNAKALKLKSFVGWLDENYDGSLDKLFALNIEPLRQQLLSVHGIGEETADSVILYAANKPIFVIDSYTRRIMSRIGLKPEKESYSAYQSLFMNNLRADVQMFNEYHALLVCLGKNVCRYQPLCRQCCLNDVCQYYLNC